MSTISRLTRSSLLVLLTATLTTGAYARGGGHAGSNAPMHSSFNSSAVHAATIKSATLRSSTLRVGKTIVSRHGGKTLPTGAVAAGGGSQQSLDPNVRDHCSLGSICNTYANWQGEGGLGDADVPAPNQDHQTGSGGQVNDHRTVVHDHRN